jgi:hypothetical protein
MMMQHGIKGVLLLVFVCAIALTAVAQDPEQESVNVSSDRTWGVGLQVGMPYGGLISVRSWFSPTFGAEAIAFVSGDAFVTEGTITARGLYRVSDTNVVDFYVAAGATFPLRFRSPVLSVLGGIEFGFRAAPALAWNIEFGASYDLDGYLNMSIGTGLHYYFPAR